MWLELAPEADPLVLSLAAGGGLLVLGLLIRRGVRRAGVAKTEPVAAAAAVGVGAAEVAPSFGRPVPPAAQPAPVEVQRAPAAITTPAVAPISFAEAFAAPPIASPETQPVAPARVVAPSKPSSTATVQPLPSAAAVAATMAAAELARARKRT